MKPKPSDFWTFEKIANETSRKTYPTNWRARRDEFLDALLRDYWLEFPTDGASPPTLNIHLTLIHTVSGGERFTPYTAVLQRQRSCLPWWRQCSPKSGWLRIGSAPWRPTSLPARHPPLAGPIWL